METGEEAEAGKLRRGRLEGCCGRDISMDKTGSKEQKLLIIVKKIFHVNHAVKAFTKVDKQ